VREDGRIVGGKGWKEVYITERNGRSSWERQGIVAFCTCLWNEWMNEWMWNKCSLIRVCMNAVIWIDDTYKIWGWGCDYEYCLMGRDTVRSGKYHHVAGYAAGFLEQLVNWCQTSRHHRAEQNNFLSVQNLLFVCLLLLWVGNCNLLHAFNLFRHVIASHNTRAARAKRNDVKTTKCTGVFPKLGAWKVLHVCLSPSKHQRIYCKPIRSTRNVTPCRHITR
jgi:hypothetical protein